MTFRQIGAIPNPACAHSTFRPGCHICENHDAVVSAEPAQAITTIVRVKPGWWAIQDENESEN